jgi:hypothetical protein
MNGDPVHTPVNWTDIAPGNDSTNRHTVTSKTEIGNQAQMDILVVDTGGGNTSTTTSRACLVLHRTNHVTELTGYQDKTEPQ